MPDNTFTLHEIRTVPHKQEILALCKNTQHAFCYIFHTYYQEPIDCVSAETINRASLLEELISFGYTRNELARPAIPITNAPRYQRLCLKDFLTIMDPDLPQILDNEFNTNIFSSGARIARALTHRFNNTRMT